MLDGLENVQTNTKNEGKKKEQLSEFKQLDKKIQKTRGDLNVHNEKMLKNVRIYN